MSSPGTSARGMKRSVRIKSNRGQCRRKCSWSSFPIPHTGLHRGLKRSKLCLNLCSLRGLKFTCNFVSFLIYVYHIIMSWTLHTDFLHSLITAGSLRLNFATTLEALIFLSRNSIRKGSFGNRYMQNALLFQLTGIHADVASSMKHCIQPEFHEKDKLVVVFLKIEKMLRAPIPLPLIKTLPSQFLK